MKKDILEHIIKNVLFEQKQTKTETVRSLQLVDASKKDRAEAIAAGAVAAFNCKIKGKVTSTQTVFRQMVSIVNTDPAVGGFSKYANKDHIYICSEINTNDLSQLIKIRIFKLKNPPFETTFETGDADVNITQYMLGRIGNSPESKDNAVFLSKNDYELLEPLQKNKDSLNLNNLETQTDEDILDTDNEEVKRQEWLNQNDTENISYPYMWYTYDNTKQPVKFTVYKETILDNVPYLYFYDKQYDLFFVMKRVDQFLPTIVKEQLNPNFTSYTWQKLWDQIDISTITPEENTKLQIIAQKEQ